MKFHNGDPLTAEDVVFSFLRYKGSLAKTIHGKMEKVEAVNPYSVRIRFKEPFPEFLEYLLPGATTIGWIVPKKYVEKVGDAGFKKHPIGAGPYKFVELVPGVKLVGEAFEEYWRKVPHVKRMEFYNIPEPATRLAMVKRGEADIATLMQGVFYEDLKKDPESPDAGSPEPGEVGRLPHGPVGSPSRLGRTHGCGWRPAWPSTARPWRTFTCPAAGRSSTIGLEGDPMAVDFPPYPYDPEKAKKLLAEAGYPNGFQGGQILPLRGRVLALRGADRHLLESGGD